MSEPITPPVMHSGSMKTLIAKIQEMGITIAEKDREIERLKQSQLHWINAPITEENWPKRGDKVYVEAFDGDELEFKVEHVSDHRIHFSMPGQPLDHEISKADIKRFCIIPK